MSRKITRLNIGKHGLNQVYLVGEVIDFGAMPHINGMRVRARLRVRCSNKNTSYSYLDVYGRRGISELMTLVCQVGNIVYIEGEIRNATYDRVCLKPYVMVMNVECLRKHTDKAPPTPALIKIIDDIDPINYLDDTKIEQRRNKKRRNKEENNG